MTTLTIHFGRNQYFKRRRGDILLPPEEQEVIRLMLEKVGADSKMDFNKYEEHINWSVWFLPSKYLISTTLVSLQCQLLDTPVPADRNSSIS